jgi:N-acetylglutamate synthase
MQLHRGLIGQRVVVRRALPGEVGPSGGPALTDVIGVLEAWEDDSLSVRRESGEVVIIPLADVAAGKQIPPRSAGSFKQRTADGS